MIHKLRVKLIILSMSSLFCLLLIIVGSSNLLSYRKVVENADTILSTLAENAGKFPNMKDSKIPPPEKKFFPKGFSGETPYESRYFTVTVSNRGEVLNANTDRIATVDQNKAMKMAEEVWEDSKHFGFENSFRYIKKAEGSNFLLIFLDCERNLSTFRTGLLFNCLVSLIGFMVVFVIISLLSKRIVKPVSESYEKQKKFIAVAGHEIRTPLTIIDADLEVLMLETGENEWISDIRKQTSRLAELTNDLISLSRMEEQKVQLQRIDFPLSDLVAETLQSFELLAQNAGRTITAEIEPMLSYCGDTNAIHQLVTILLDNAIKYSGENGIISLSLEKKNHNIILSVRNSSEPVTEEQLSHFFERFYRREESRNSSTGGYGLGLSIAKAIVTAHKGKITASAPDGESVMITVTLHG